MDEFDKIRELSEGLSQRKEPTFTSFGQQNTSYNQHNLGVNQQQTAYNQQNQQQMAYNQPNVGFNDLSQGTNQPNTGFNQQRLDLNQQVLGVPQQNSNYNQPMSGSAFQSTEFKQQEPAFHDVSHVSSMTSNGVGIQPQPHVGSNPYTTPSSVENFVNQPTAVVPEKRMDFVGAPEEEINFEPLTQDIEEKDLPNMRFHIVFILVLGIVLILSLVGFYLFKMEAGDSDEIATITASQDLVKEAPEQAGGLNIPDQDKLVYNRIRTDSVTTKVESLFPEPEKPVLPQILAIEQNAPEEDFVSMNEVEGVNPFEMPVEQPVVEEKIVIPTPIVPEPVQEPKIVEKPKLPPVEVKEEPVEVAKPKKEVITLPLATAPVASVKIEKAPVQEEGIWRVQLFASNNKEAVEKVWKRIEAKHNKLLSNMSYLIKKVEIKGKGVFYRLQVGQFPTREMADGLCSKLKARKQDCIPTK